MESDRARAKLRSIAFVNHCLGSQTFDPGKGSGVGEAEVVGEEEEKGLVVGVVLK